MKRQAVDGKDNKTMDDKDDKDDMMMMMKGVDLGDVIGKVIYHMIAYGDSHVMLMSSLDDIVKDKLVDALTKQSKRGEHLSNSFIFTKLWLSNLYLIGSVQLCSRPIEQI